MGNGKALALLSAEIMSAITEASKYNELEPYAKKLGAKLKLVQEVLQFLMPFAQKGDYERFLSDATVFMEFFGNIVIGWLWLEMATKAQSSLVAGDSRYTSEFFNGKVHAMKFYYKYELPKTMALAEVLMNKEVLTVAADAKMFT